MDCYLCGHVNEPERASCEHCGSTLLLVVDRFPAQVSTAAPVGSAAPPAPPTPGGVADPQTSQPIGRADPLAPDPEEPTPGPDAHPAPPDPATVAGDAPPAPLPTMRIGEEPVPTPGQELHHELEGLRPSVSTQSPMIVVPRFSELGTIGRTVLLVAATVALLAGGWVILNSAGGSSGGSSDQDLAFAEPTTTAPVVVLTDAELAAHGEAVFRVEATSCGVSTVGAAFALDETHLIAPATVVLAARPEIVTPEGERLPTTVLGTSDSPDVAVLQVETPLDVRVPGGSGIGLVDGQEVVVLTPSGEVVPTTISAFRAGWGGPRYSFTVTGELSAELSGAPVLDRTGRLVAVANQLTGGPSAGSMVFYAIDETVDRAREIIDGGAPAADCGRAGLPVAPAEVWGDPSYGSADLASGDAVLDSVAARCRDEEWGACDDLVLTTWNSATAYWELGLGCGGTEAASTRFCVQRKGAGTFDPQETHAVGDCLVLPRVTVGSFRNAPCDDPHDAEVYFTGRWDEPLDYLLTVPTTSTTAPPPADAPLDIPAIPPASVSNRALVDPTAVSTVIPEIERRCQKVFEELVLVERWDVPFEVGVILPDGDSRRTAYSCFVHRSGSALTQSYFAEG